MYCEYSVVYNLLDASMFYATMSISVLTRETFIFNEHKFMKTKSLFLSLKRLETVAVCQYASQCTL